MDNEQRKAKARAYWQRYRRTLAGAAKIKARESARAADSVINRRKHLARKTLHPDRLRATRRTNDRKQRALKQGVPFALPTKDEPMCPVACVMCSAPFAPYPDALQPTLDRVVPDLGYVPNNVQWIHNSCNSLKGTYTLSETKVLASHDPRFVSVVAYIEQYAPQ